MTERTTVIDVTDDATTENEGNGPEWQERDKKLALEFSRRLLDARLAKWPKLTQEVAAREIGVSLRQYQRWEHGEQVPPFERIGRVVEVVGVDISDLVEPTGALTRDGLKSYFDKRIESIETVVQANHSLLREAIDDLDELNHEILKTLERLEARLQERGVL